MDVKNYHSRVCDIELQEQLEASGAVLIEGAKWCGKTFTARHAAQNALFMQDRDQSKRYKQIAASTPSLLLEGATPRLIDEWEEAPVLWDAVRFAVDLRVYAQANDGDVFHYHDKKNLECDLVVALRDGRWAAVEVKMGMHEEEDAAKNLLTLATDVDEQRMLKPSFLMILTGGRYAYRREDGVYVVPIGCLKP